MTKKGSSEYFLKMGVSGQQVRVVQKIMQSLNNAELGYLLEFIDSVEFGMYDAVGHEIDYRREVGED